MMFGSEQYMSAIFKKIVIATDGSKLTQKAIDMGIKIAREVHSKVYAIYVVDTVTYTNIYKDVTWEPGAFLKEEGERAVMAVKDNAVGTDVETFILEGNPALEITRFAADNDCDLIVVGTLGKSGIEHILLGSVAEKVMRIASCPVLVVKSSKKPK